MESCKRVKSAIMVIVIMTMRRMLAENCKIAGCGDGVIDLNESCDDDNSENNDGCSDACLIEEGWECIGQPSACETICGDLIIAGNEECDNGLTGDLNCDYDM